MPVDATRIAQLEAENQALRAQQTATGEVLRAIASSPADPRPVLDAVAENAARLCEANDAMILRLEGTHLRSVASYGPMRPMLEPKVVNRGWVNGRAWLERRTIHIHDIVAEFDEFPDARVNHEQWGHRTTLATPMLREGAAIGTITIRRPEARPFSEQQIKLLETFADQAVIVIENARLFGELERRNAELQESNRQVNEALEQQTATAEVLRVIASSPTDLKAVLEAVVASVARLCAADSANVQRLDGDNVVVLAATHSESAGLIFPIAGTVAEDVIAEMRTVHVFGTVEEQLARYPAS